MVKNNSIHSRSFSLFYSVNSNTIEDQQLGEKLGKIFFVNSLISAVSLMTNHRGRKSWLDSTLISIMFKNGLNYCLIQVSQYKTVIKSNNKKE